MNTHTQNNDGETGGRLRKSSTATTTKSHSFQATF
jgi:hypothetical protein